jgi:hypothetical protein
MRKDNLRIDALGLGRVLLEELLGSRPDSLGLALREGEQTWEKGGGERFGGLPRKLWPEREDGGKQIESASRAQLGSEGQI